jgi:hypothetical protein
MIKSAKRSKTDKAFPPSDWEVGRIFQVAAWGELQASGKYLRVLEDASVHATSFQGNFELISLTPPGFKCLHVTSAGVGCNSTFGTGSGLFQLQRHLLGHFAVKSPPQKRGPKKRALAETLAQGSANVTGSEDSGRGGGKTATILTRFFSAATPPKNQAPEQDAEAPQRITVGTAAAPVDLVTVQPKKVTPSSHTYGDEDDEDVDMSTNNSGSWLHTFTTLLISATALISSWRGRLNMHGALWILWSG